MTDNDPAAMSTHPGPPPRNAYGQVIRERGTLRLVLAAALLGIGWYAWNTFQTGRMNQVKWPPIAPNRSGLYALGLLDRPRDGSKPRYLAIEANHAWQIRYRDDQPGEEETSSKEEAADRGSNPGASHRTDRGSVVPLEELFERLPCVMRGPNFTGASVEERLEPLFDRKYWVVHVNLSPEGRSRYWQFSREHDDERLVFVLNGEVLTCPRMHHMDVDSLTIEQFWVKADADKLVRFIEQSRG